MIPKIKLDLPRAVTALHQIEITSRCNLRCRYCAHPKMPRAKQDMEGQIFVTALARVEWFGEHYGQRELNLAGIGESTMHHNFVEMARLARFLLTDSFKLVLATNGVAMTQELADELARLKVRVFVSLHRPEKAGPAVEMLRKAGCLAGVSADPSIAATNWAGQVDWYVSANERECPWIRQGWAIVLSDGRIATCSFDGQGTDGIIGTVQDDPSSLRVKPYSLCRSCDQQISVEGYNQGAQPR